MYHSCLKCVTVPSFTRVFTYHHVLMYIIDTSQHMKWFNHLPTLTGIGTMCRTFSSGTDSYQEVHSTSYINTLIVGKLVFKFGFWYILKRYICILLSVLFWSIHKSSNIFFYCLQFAIISRTNAVLITMNIRQSLFIKLSSKITLTTIIFRLILIFFFTNWNCYFKF